VKSLLRLLLTAVLLVPLIEIVLFIQVGGRLGVGLTLLWLLISAVLGVLVIRVQGLLSVYRVRGALARGQLPAMEMLESLALVLAGILLIVPGFFTDFLALLLLIRPLRRGLLRLLIGRAPSPTRGRVIEGDYRSDDPSRRGSPSKSDRLR
jgi:UPF0716 protein FxsA